MARRRHIGTSRPLHCCCVCGHLDVWNKNWSWYGSYREMEDGVALPKFCSARCKKVGHRAVTIEMAEEARAAEVAA